MSSLILLHFDDSASSSPIEMIGLCTRQSFAGKMVASEGKFGGSLSLTAGYLNYLVPNNLITSGTPFTIEFWLKPTHSSSKVVVALNSIAATTIPEATTAPYAALSIMGTAVTTIGGTISGANATALTINTHTALALVFDGVNTLSTYINGTLQANTLNAGTISDPLYLSVTSADSVSYIDELRFSDEALYSATYTPAASAFVPLYEEEPNLYVHQLVATGVTVPEVTQEYQTTDLTQLQAVEVSAPSGAIPPDYLNLTQLVATGVSAPEVTQEYQTTDLTQLQAVRVYSSEEALPQDYLNVHQLVATGVTVPEVTQEYQTTDLTQIQAVAVSAPSNSLPPDSAYLTQVRAVETTITSTELLTPGTHATQLTLLALKGTLDKTPEARYFLSQIKASSVALEPVNRSPILFSLEKQLLQNTEPPDWVKVYSVQNLAVRQEAISGVTYTFSTQNLVVQQVDAPALPPLYLHGTLANASEVELYKSPLVLQSPKFQHKLESSISFIEEMLSPYVAQSPSKLHNVSQSVSELATLTSPFVMQSMTKALKLVTSGSLMSLMRDPATIQAGSVSFAQHYTYSAADSVDNPYSLRSFSTGLAAASNVSVQYTADDPEVVQSLTRVSSITVSDSLQDLLDTPAAMQSPSRLISNQSVVSIAATYNNPDGMLSATWALALFGLVSEQEVMVNPGVVKSPVLNNQSYALHSEVETGQQDPRLIQSWTLHKQTTAHVSALEADLENPDTIQSNTRLFVSKMALSAPITEQDPSLIQSDTDLFLVNTAFSEAYQDKASSDILSMEKLYKVETSVSSLAAMGNPGTLQSWTISAATSLQVSESYLADDPFSTFSPKYNLQTFGLASEVDLLPSASDMQSPSKSLRGSSSYSYEVSTYKDPITITPTTLQLMAFGACSASVEMDDPNQMISSTVNVSTHSMLSMPEEYLNPRGIYEHPARNQVTIMSISAPVVYESPFMSGPVVNIHHLRERV